MPEDRDDRYFGFVQSHDAEPRRRLFDVLAAQGLQMNQELTFLTDGGDSVRGLAQLMSPCAEHILDWFHIAMRLTVLGQYAKGLAQHNPKEAEDAEAHLEKIKWQLWHGDVREALFRCPLAGRRPRSPGERLSRPEALRPLGGGVPHLRRQQCRRDPELRRALALWRADLDLLRRIRRSTSWSASGSPSGSRCSGRGGAPTCCCRPGPEPSTARCAACSSAGSRALPTTTSPAPNVLTRPDPPHALWRSPSLSPRLSARPSPGTWAHVNLLGEYDFSDEKLRDSFGLRPARSPLDQHLCPSSVSRFVPLCKRTQVEAVYPMAYETFADVAVDSARFIDHLYNRQRLPGSGARCSGRGADRSSWGSGPAVCSVLLSLLKMPARRRLRWRCGRGRAACLGIFLWHGGFRPACLSVSTGGAISLSPGRLDLVSTKACLLKPRLSWCDTRSP